MDWLYRLLKHGGPESTGTQGRWMINKDVTCGRNPVGSGYDQ